MSLSFLTVPCTFISIWAFSKYKLSSVLRFVSLVQLVGMGVRDLALLTDSFAPLLIGAIMQASTMTFFVNIQAWVANRWFPDQ